MALLKSREIMQEISDLKNQLAKAKEAGQDCSELNGQLADSMDRYDHQIEIEQKLKNQKGGTAIMTVKDERKIVNRVLTNLLTGKQVADADKAYMPKVVDVATGQYYAPTSAPESGAYLVSEEFLPIEKQNSQYVNLTPYVRTIAVSKPTGKIPVVDMSQDIELPDFTVDNDTEIAKKSVAFSQQAYTLANRGAIISVGLDLLEDSDEDLLSIVNDCFVRAHVVSRNKDIITALGQAANTLTADFADVALIDKIKEAIHSKLDITYGINAKVLMCQADFVKLITLKNEDGDYYVQPMVTEPGKYQIDGHEIIVVENKYFTSGSNVGGTVYVGDMQQILNISRKELELSSDLSSGFKTYSLNVRAVGRYVVKNICTKAFVKITASA